MQKPGINIILKENPPIWFSFSQLHVWKWFVERWERKDVDKIEVLYYSVQNSQLVKRTFQDDELNGFELCYVASTIMGQFAANFVAVYIPHLATNYRMLINESFRLVSEGTTAKQRNGRFALKH